MHRPNTRVWLLLLIVTLSLAGCGFQPRGQNNHLSGLPNPIHVVGVNRFSKLHREIEKQLNIAGVKIAEDATNSQATLRIIRWKSDERVLSLNSRNKVVEYEMEQILRFSLRTPDGEQRIPPQLIRVLRIRFNPETAVLGSFREGGLLREDMLKEAVERMLSHVAAQS